MSHEPPAGWIDRRVHAAMQGDLDALRAALSALTDRIDADRTEIAELRAQSTQHREEAVELRAMIRGIGVEIGSRAERTEASLSAMRDATEATLAAMREERDRDAKLEALRLRVEGLIAQHRWDADQLRQSLAAVAERLPLDD